MRRYETFVIFDPDLSEDQRAPIVDRIKETITKQDGFLVEIDDWGSRKLAYEIKKKFRGYYSRLDYCGGGPLVNELERFFRIDDRVLKYMTVQLEESADLEKIKEEIAQAEAQKAEKARSRSEAAAKAAEAKAAASEAPAPEPPVTETAAPETSASEEPASEEPAPETSKAPAAEAVETETQEPTSETKPVEAGKEE
jgi:small subunit ribosomal protein S6